MSIILRFSLPQALAKAKAPKAAAGMVALAANAKWSITRLENQQFISKRAIGMVASAVSAKQSIVSIRY